MLDHMLIKIIDQMCVKVGLCARAKVDIMMIDLICVKVGLYVGA